MPDPYLVNYLAEQDIECPGCGYNLRGLTGECCPECGQALVLRVGLAEPKMGSFLAALIALTTGLGFNVIVLMWGVWEMRFGFGPDWGDLASLIVFSLILGLATVMLIRHRQWFRSLPIQGVLIVIVGCALLSVASVVVFLSVAA
jgi:hypothetical protein